MRITNVKHLVQSLTQNKCELNTGCFSFTGLPLAQIFIFPSHYFRKNGFEMKSGLLGTLEKDL